MTSAPQPPVIVVEDDPFTRILQVVLDPAVPPARIAAFTDFFAHDLPDFPGWCENLRARLGALNPAKVKLVASQAELDASLTDADAVLVESFQIGASQLAAAPQLRAIQKFGTILGNIDAEACSARAIRVLTVRRRANIACAEHALSMMLALARKLTETDGLVSVESLTAAGFHPRMFDRAHTAKSNWARISGVSTLYGKQLGIVGLGEIGRELALRAAAFGMRIVYYQRTRLTAADEDRYHAAYCTLDELLGKSDFVSLHLPATDSTRGIIGARELGLMKRGAHLINVSRADLIDRNALIAALSRGSLGGFGLDTPYEEPGRDDDPLLEFRNVIVTPHLAAQPRFNALGDFEEMLVNLDCALK